MSSMLSQSASPCGHSWGTIISRLILMTVTMLDSVCTYESKTSVVHLNACVHTHVLVCMRVCVHVCMHVCREATHTHTYSMYVHICTRNVFTETCIPGKDNHADNLLGRLYSILYTSRVNPLALC